MILKVFSVKDIAVDAFMRPFYFPHSGMATRSFEDEIDNKDSLMNKHPKDFILYEIAEFDEDKGLFTNLEQPKMLLRASDIFEAKRIKSNGSG